MELVTRVRCSFRGEDAGSVNSQSYWRAEDAATGRAARPGDTDSISPNPPSSSGLQTLLDHRLSRRADAGVPGHGREEVLPLECIET